MSNQSRTAFGNPPRRDNFNPSSHSQTGSSSRWWWRRHTSFSYKVPHPRRCPAQGLQYSSARADGSAPYAPPPEVAYYGAGDGLGCGPWAAHEEVEADHDIGEIGDGEGQETHEGGLGAGRGEGGREVG